MKLTNMDERRRETEQGKAKIIADEGLKRLNPQPTLDHWSLIRIHPSISPNTINVSWSDSND